MLLLLLPIDAYSHTHTNTHRHIHRYAWYCFVFVVILRILSGKTVSAVLSSAQVCAAMAGTKTATITTITIFALHLIE